MDSVDRNAKLFIAIASDENLDSNKFSEKSNLLDVSDTYFHYMDDHISNLEDALSSRDDHISNLDGILKSKELYISSLETMDANNEKRLQMIPEIVCKLIEDLKQENISSSLSIRIGEMCFGLDIYDNANYFFEKALNIEPGSSDALNNLGVLSSRNGDYDMAREYFMRSLDHNPENEEAKVNLATISEIHEQ